MDDLGGKNHYFGIHPYASETAGGFMYAAPIDSSGGTCSPFTGRQAVPAWHDIFVQQCKMLRPRRYRPWRHGMGEGGRPEVMAISGDTYITYLMI